MPLDSSAAEAQAEKKRMGTMAKAKAHALICFQSLWKYAAMTWKDQLLLVVVLGATWSVCPDFGDHLESADGDAALEVQLSRGSVRVYPMVARHQQYYIYPVRVSKIQGNVLFDNDRSRICYHPGERRHLFTNLDQELLRCN